MSRYVIGAAEVAVNPSNAAQVAPPGTISPADAASKEALKEEMARQGGVGISPTFIIGALIVGGLGWVAYKDAKKADRKRRGGAPGHVLA